MKAVHLPTDRAFLRYIEIPGDDPPLLWLHGWQCSSTGELMPAAVQAPLRGRRSLVIDFLGHGYSDKPLEFGYGVEDHARTVVALIDALNLGECGLIGHSMGGEIAVLVAAARPAVVSLLVMAEGNLGPEGDDRFDGQSERQFVEHGFPDLLGSQEKDATARPDGLRAAHVGITRLVEPRAIYREAVSMEAEINPTVRSVLGGLDIPRWYLVGGLSDPEPGIEEEMGRVGVGWKVVPET
jgi:pimeloyl-ACP methyl ester carboxylesterase